MITTAILTRIPLFLGLSAETLKDLCPMIRRMKIPAGTHIFREGTEARELYFLDEGRVDISIREPMPGGGLVYIARPGECFGWSALVPPNFFTATAKTHSPSAVLVVNAELLKLQMAQHSELMRVILENIASTISRRLEGTRIRRLNTAMAATARIENPAEIYFG